MSEILVVVDHAAGDVRPLSLRQLEFAAGRGTVVAAVAGEGAGEAAERIRSSGVHAVLVGETVQVDRGVAVPYVDFLERIHGQRDLESVLFPDTPAFREVAARLAVRLGAGILVGATRINDDWSVDQAAFAGSHTLTARVTGGLPIIVAKAAAVEGIGSGDTEKTTLAPAQVLDMGSAPGESTGRKPFATILESRPKEKDSRPPLTEAAVVVAGGIGTGGDFGPVEELADALGGAVGATRAAADEGWISRDAQIGQTGVTVSPQLFISAGISGAIQQKSGMQTSKTIVAVNNDPDALVFEIADFGVVGDLHEVLPQATAEILRRRSGR